MLPSPSSLDQATQPLGYAWTVPNPTRPRYPFGLSPVVRLTLLGGAALTLLGQTALIAPLLLLGTLLVPVGPGFWALARRAGLTLLLLGFTWQEHEQVLSRLTWPANPWAAVWPAAFVGMIALLWIDRIVRTLLLGPASYATARNAQGYFFQQLNQFYTLPRWSQSLLFVLLQGVLLQLAAFQGPRSGLLPALPTLAPDQIFYLLAVLLLHSWVFAELIAGLVKPATYHQRWAAAGLLASFTLCCFAHLLALGGLLISPLVYLGLGLLLINVVALSLLDNGR